MRFLALGGVAGPGVFASVTVVCAALRPEYSHATQFISELGETAGTNAALMNFLGFMPTGVLIAAFGAALAVGLPRTPLSAVAAALITVFGLGIIGAGVYSCDPGCPSPGVTFEAAMHNGMSAVAFASCLIGIALWAARFRRLPGWEPMWGYSAASSAVAFVFLTLMVSSEEARSFTGAWQRLFLATLFLWCAVVGLRLFRTERQAS